MDLEIGSTVKVKGQYVLLTVEGVQNNRGINVLWFDQIGVLHHACIERILLEPVTT